MDIAIIVVISLITHFIIFCIGYYISVLEGKEAMRKLAQKAYDQGFDKAKTMFAIGLREF